VAGLLAGEPLPEEVAALSPDRFARCERPVHEVRA
jgi:hypothetical protein